MPAAHAAQKRAFRWRHPHSRHLHLSLEGAYICHCPRGIRAMIDVTASVCDRTLRYMFHCMSSRLLRVFALGALLISAFSPVALAQGPRVVPQSPADARLSYAPIVARVAPAVVNVY